jgi:hypothetical protein
MILSNQASDTSMENFNNILAKDIAKTKESCWFLYQLLCPLALLEYYYNEASIYNATLVFNGLPNNSFKELSDFDRASI